MLAIRAELKCYLGGKFLDARDALQLRAEFVVVHHVGQFWRARFEFGFLILLEEKFRIRQARAQHAFVAVDDVLRIGGFEVAHHQKFRQQFPLAIQQRKIFLVLFHGENQALLRYR